MTQNIHHWLLSQNVPSQHKVKLPSVLQCANCLQYVFLWFSLHFFINTYHYNTHCLCYCKLIFYTTSQIPTLITWTLSVFFSSFLSNTTQFNSCMHAISHSLVQQAHRAPPATCTWTCGSHIVPPSPSLPILHLPVISIPSSVTSASPTPQTLTICKNNCLQNAIITPPIVSQARELPICDVQKSRYVIGLVGESKAQTVALVLMACMIKVQFFDQIF